MTKYIVRTQQVRIRDMSLFSIRNQNYATETILPLQDLTFFLSLIEPFPRTIILHPVSASSCLAVSPLGPRILPTKLN